MSTAFPLTSRPTKSAAVPVLTQTRSNSTPPGGVEGAVLGRPGGLQREGRAAAGEGNGERLRRPLRCQIERLSVDVLQAELPEVALDPVLGLGVALEADVASPEQRAAGLIAPRNRRRLANHRLHLHAVDVRVPAVLGQQRHLVEGVLLDALRCDSSKGLPSGLGGGGAPVPAPARRLPRPSARARPASMALMNQSFRSPAGVGRAARRHLTVAASRCRRGLAAS